jgi:N-acetylglutamate synthase-like GNAT family acetyltransferase
VADLAVRLATAADVPALHALIEGAYRGDSARAGWTHEADLLDGQRTDVVALADMLADPAQRLLVAESDGRLTGCVSLRTLADGGVYLGLLTVDPALQAAGLGRRLLAAAETQARDAGASRIEMTVIARRVELIAWYERRGYTQTGERRPFPLDDPRFGLPRTRDLEFVVLEKSF